ncbi:hypothetical protein GH733_002426 [Mirounga leonina]|nr:hypothetical protein GH733_002426 [Mirounga leonina]
MAQDELILRWKQYEAYVQALESKYTDLNSNDATGLRESKEKLKQQQKSAHREKSVKQGAGDTIIYYSNPVPQASPAAKRYPNEMNNGRRSDQWFFLKMKGLALQKKYSQELKCSQNELNVFIIQLDRSRRYAEHRSSSSAATERDMLVVGSVPTVTVSHSSPKYQQDYIF